MEATCNPTRGSSFSEAPVTQPDLKLAVLAGAKRQRRRAMIGTLRNVFLSPSLPPSKYLAVHLLIILSRLLEEGDPTAAATRCRRWPLRWKKEREQSGEEFENGRRQTAAQCTRKRGFLCGGGILCKSFFFLWDISTNRKTSPTDKNRVVSFSSSSASFNTVVVAKISITSLRG